LNQARDAEEILNQRAMKTGTIDSNVLDIQEYTMWNFRLNTNEIGNKTIYNTAKSYINKLINSITNRNKRIIIKIKKTW